MEVIKERINDNIEKRKIAAWVVILLTGGLIGLLFDNEMEISYRKILFVIGAISDIIAVLYYLNLNKRIKKLLNIL